MRNVCVIGAGASGLMAALYAAKNGARVTVYEGNSEPGKKILRTGNGKCNFSNLVLSEDNYNTDSKEFVKDALNKFSRNDLLFYFSQIGLLIREKNGYLYPYCEKASALRDVLLSEAKSLGITIKNNAYINCLTKEADGSFLVSVEGIKERFSYDRVILATGGKAGLLPKDRENGFDILKKLGIESSRLYPGLTKLICNGDFLKDLDGVRNECSITLKINDENVKTEQGEILFRTNGVSGICVFILSSLCKKALVSGKSVSLTIDLLPSFDENSLKNNISVRYHLNSDKSVEEFFKGIFCNELNNELMRRNRLNPHKQISDYSIDIITNAVISMKNITLPVIDVGDFKEAQVTVGGIACDEITEFMESKKIPGLYIVGELIDIDGPCGGYNLQWAFTTGAIAGEHACYR